MEHILDSFRLMLLLNHSQCIGVGLFRLEPDQFGINDRTLSFYVIIRVEISGSMKTNFMYSKRELGEQEVDSALWDRNTNLDDIQQWVSTTYSRWYDDIFSMP